MDHWGEAVRQDVVASCCKLRPIIDVKALSIGVLICFFAEVGVEGKGDLEEKCKQDPIAVCDLYVRWAAGIDEPTVLPPPLARDNLDLSDYGQLYANVDCPASKHPRKFKIKYRSDLKSTLFPFQVDNVNWLVKRERSVHPRQGWFHGMWKKVVLPLFKQGLNLGQRHFYFELFTGTISSCAPPWLPDVPGSILADEMGLGKTCQTLTLVLQNPFSLDFINARHRWVHRHSGDFLRANKSLQYCKATLVICPRILVNHWEAEVGKHCPEDLVLTTVTTSRPISVPTLLGLGSRSVVLVSFDDFKLQFGTFKRVHWWRVCVDEAQYIGENHNMHKSKRILNVDIGALESVHRLCITGTPMSANGLQDLQGQFSFLRLYPFADKFGWWNRSIVAPFRTHPGEVMESLQAVMSKTMRRNTTLSVRSQIDLPKIQVITEFVTLASPLSCLVYLWHLHGLKFLEQKPIPVIKEAISQLEQAAVGHVQYPGFESQIRRHYNSRFKNAIAQIGLLHRRQMTAEAKEILDSLSFSNDFEELLNHRDLRKQISNGLTQTEPIAVLDDAYELGTGRTVLECQTLRDEAEQLELLARRFHAADKEPANMLKLVPECALLNFPKLPEKFDALIARLQKLVTVKGNKCLLFASNSRSLDSIERRLQRLSIPCWKASRGTEDRTSADLITKFSKTDNTECQILLLGLKIGGEGLNLTAANHVLFVDHGVNVASLKQGIGRIFRLGQTRNACVYFFITKGTIEEKSYDFANKWADITEAPQQGMTVVIEALRKQLKPFSVAYDVPKENKRITQSIATIPAAGVSNADISNLR